VKIVQAVIFEGNGYVLLFKWILPSGVAKSGMRHKVEEGILRNERRGIAGNPIEQKPIPEILISG